MKSPKAEAKDRKQLKIHQVFTQEPHPSSYAALVLLMKKLSETDIPLFSNARMKSIRNNWMKIQLKAPDEKGGLTCAICGKKGLLPWGKKGKSLPKNHPKLATLDHIVELRNGGSWDSPTNFRVACSLCNSRRERNELKEKSHVRN